MEIPDEVIEAAEKTLTDARIAFSDDPSNYAQSPSDGELLYVVAPVIAEWARREALRDAAATVMGVGDARVKKARDEQERGRELAAHHELRQSQLAHDHAWALRNQADGLWEAANAIRALAEGASHDRYAAENADGSLGPRTAPRIARNRGIA